MTRLWNLSSLAVTVLGCDILGFLVCRTVGQLGGYSAPYFSNDTYQHHLPEMYSALFHRLRQRFPGVDDLPPDLVGEPAQFLATETASALALRVPS